MCYSAESTLAQPKDAAPGASMFRAMKIPDRFLRGPGEPIGAFPCPCCHFLTLDEPPPGTYEICSICGWEDDPVQFDDPDYKGGANRPSLNECRNRFEAEQLPELRQSGFNFPPRAEPID